MLAASAAGVCQACKDPRFKKKAALAVVVSIRDGHRSASAIRLLVPLIIVCVTITESRSLSSLSIYGTLHISVEHWMPIPVPNLSHNPGGQGSHAMQQGKNGTWQQTSGLLQPHARTWFIAAELAHSSV